MALKKISLTTGPEDAKKRLDQFLSEKLPGALAQPLSKAKVRKLIVAGAVYLNGRRVRIASKELLPRARVETYVDLAKLLDDGRGRDRAFEMTAERVLFEDEFLIVVDKPAGLPTQPTMDEARDNLFNAVKRFLSQRDGVTQPYVGLHHRLDRDTSGVILFTKKAEANAATAALFTEHLAQKTYNALTHSPRTPLDRREWVIQNYLGKGKSSGKKARYTAVRSGGDFAHTDFQVLEAHSRGLWVEARPKTGRTHQIRVHLAEYGVPILGDTFYGAKEGSAPRVMLHAACLTFPHPVHKTLVTVQSPLPEDFLVTLAALSRR